MAARTSPTFRRRRLGRRLKELREGASLTLEEAAPLLDKARSSLARIERGESLADVHLVRSMMDVYDVRDDRLVELARDAARKGWWRQYGLSDMGYVDVETEASRVLEFTVLNIPGLLQTEKYMHAQMIRGSRRRTEEQLHNQLEVRRIRQQRLTDDEHPLELNAIVDESALHRVVGGPNVMGAQLLRLAEANTLARVIVQVLPFESGWHNSMHGAFTVLEFPESEDPDIFYVAHTTGAVHVEKSEEVRKAKLVHEALRSQALPPQESTALIERVAQRYLDSSERR